MSSSLTGGTAVACGGAGLGTEAQGSWPRSHELRDRPVRDYYNDLFSAHVPAAGHPEELELVVGTSLLAWTAPSGGRVRRHLLTTAARIDFDEDSGRLTVLVDDSVEGSVLELDMLDPGLIGQPKLVNELRDRARESDAHPMDRDRMGELGRTLTHQLAADARFLDTDDPTTPGASPVTSFAPALLLRRRLQKGLLEIFRRIVEQLREAGEVPDGIRPLVDADHEPAGTADGEHAGGAVVRVDDDPFLPLPVNDRQLQILRRVASGQHRADPHPGSARDRQDPHRGSPHHPLARPGQADPRHRADRPSAQGGAGEAARGDPAAGRRRGRVVPGGHVGPAGRRRTDRVDRAGARRRRRRQHDPPKSRRRVDGRGERVQVDRNVGGRDVPGG
ncbi:hypothetical protein LWC33_16200 [Pseudonocardia sp. RS11V-5]|nr:hypothetical protein [Pseudonocardia terrae]MCE3552993.1 hypothetical protein [Pseudonocardia terrae]